LIACQVTFTTILGGKDLAGLLPREVLGAGGAGLDQYMRDHGDQIADLMVLVSRPGAKGSKALELNRNTGLRPAAGPAEDDDVVEESERISL
jgi:hypothetical protein